MTETTPSDKGTAPEPLRCLDHDWGVDVDVSTTILLAIADLEDASIMELPPLFSSLDPEALDTLLESGTQSTRSISITFTYADYVITVEDAGEIRVRTAETEASEEGDPSGGDSVTDS